MTRKQFESLVTRLERKANDQMKSYRLKVALLAAGGYVYVVLILALTVAAVSGLLALALTKGGGGALILKLGLPLGALAVTVFRALWVRWPEPEGIRLSEQQAPKLFQEVEFVRSQLRAPKVHRILLNSSFNAAMEQRPRLGIFGWPEGLLHLGLPLMQALSPAEFRGVLAHEMGHLSGNHGRITGWVYRIRQTWSRLLERLEAEQRWGSSIFTRFFKWYAPLLNAYSFVLARAQEYEADKCAAAVVGRDTAASMLVSVAVRGRFIDQEFWPGLWKKANDHPQPPSDPYFQQVTALRTAPLEDGTQRRLAQALAAKTGYVDTHPSLHDRLDALGVEPSIQKWIAGAERPAKPSAAEQMLTPSLERWYEELHNEWLAAVKPSWEARHAEVQDQRKRLAELQQKPDETVTNEERWELATLLSSIDGDDAAFLVFEKLVTANPQHVSAQFEIGRILLERGDDTGIQHLNKAMQLDPECTPGACYLIENFLRNQGKSEEAARYSDRGMEHAELSEEATKERHNVTAQDTFSPHGLDEEQITKLRDHLRRYTGLKLAYLVRKNVTLFPQRPAYVLGIIPQGAWFSFKSDGSGTTLINEIAQTVPLPEGTWVMLLSTPQKTLLKKIRKTPNACVYGD